MRVVSGQVAKGRPTIAPDLNLAVLRTLLQNQVTVVGRLKWKWQESVPQRLKPSGAGYLRHG